MSFKPTISLAGNLRRLSSSLRSHHFDRHRATLSKKREFFGARSFCSVENTNVRPIFDGTKDRFNCVTIDVAADTNQDFCRDCASFGNVLDESLKRWQDELCNAVWLHIPLEYSHLISAASKRGFTYHHAEDELAVMSLWLLDDPSRLPAFATHTVGVSGFVLNEEKREVLMVQDKHRLARWKFPGGFSSFGEDIPMTAMREVFEETGIHTEFQGVLAFRQQHNMPSGFGRSDIYVVTHLKPTTFDINICTAELSNAAWTPVEELTDPENEHTHLTVRMAKLIDQGLREGFDKVDIGIHELPAVYKNMTYKLFHRPIHGL